jgi:DNA-binding transcriptional LysR family regulator
VDLRHLRCFLAVAEELHFARAAERLHIEQSPLSRTIKELEYSLGVRLFVRTTRSTRLTWAGQVFLEDARRVLVALEQAKDNAKAAANGYRGTLRVALSDDISPSRLAALLAQCRAEEPEVEIRLFQVPFQKQVKGLHSDLFDAGLAQSAEVSEGVIAEAVWVDPLVVALPARHPLLIHKSIPLEEVLRYPLVLAHPEACQGCSRQIERMLRTAGVEPQVAEYVGSHDLFLTLIVAGYGVGLTYAARAAMCQSSSIITRPLAGRAMTLTTYLLRPDTDPSLQLSHFIDRVNPEEMPAEGPSA